MQEPRNTAVEPASRPRLFGTDGIRGTFGEPPLVRSAVTLLGFELATILASGELREHRGRPRVALGGDTRASTGELCRWLAAGLTAGGSDVVYLGVVPTPGIAHLVRQLPADAGVVVSASHNPHPDNGIKLIDRRGFKWTEEAETILEERLAREAARPPMADPPLPPVDTTAVDAYLASLAASLPPDRPLAGLRLALDPGNGAASAYAGPLFAELGAEVEVICAEPDGRNINRGCGSTQPGLLAAAVRRSGLDLGIAFDGDADRSIFVDGAGAVRDGDAALYLWATDLLERGALDPPRIVATSMSNLGLERALAAHGVELVRCDVGDRVVVETLLREGLVLGGEQSGHIVHLGLTTTGDGLLTALQIASIVRRKGRPLAELLAGFRRYPQVLRNVRVARKRDFGELPRVRAAARRVEERLGREGRLVLRYSGTEPLARIMIEGPDQQGIESLAADLAEALEASLGTG